MKIPRISKIFILTFCSVNFLIFNEFISPPYDNKTFINIIMSLFTSFSYSIGNDILFKIFFLWVIFSIEI